MVLDAEACYRALRTRDPRFDGRIYVGVRTTRIYCRPICPARTARRENVGFFPSAAAAESEGFRPCLRCRPELAPGHASVDANARLLQAALSRIEGGDMESGGLESLARGLGVSSRHLRRVFLAELGVTPVAYTQTARLLLAKRLLTDSSLPVTQVAFTSGFGSVRRFNALFQQRYRLAPSSLRRERRTGSAESETGHRLRLGYRAPLDWSGLLAFLGARAVPQIESVADGRYRRTVRIAHRGTLHGGWIEVAPARGDTLELFASASLGQVLPQLIARARHLFDLSADPAAIDSRLGMLAGTAGARVPGSIDGFELAVRAVLGQQVTVVAAKRIAARLVERFGTPTATPFEALNRYFPTADELADAAPAALGEAGLIRQRGKAVRALARACREDQLRLGPDVDVPRTLQALCSLPGIGPWTAQYIAMRALRWPDAFPAQDVALWRALGVGTARAAEARARDWQPWRAYAAIHLWRAAGTVTPRAAAANAH
jgi:AraC family transcriptional regulator, regulatory protein of adaptative response / DNA-3-methyladenine glycosylase II